MVPNGIAPAIRTDSRPVYRRKPAQITKLPATPVEMHKWDAPTWTLVAKPHFAGEESRKNWPSASALTEVETSVKKYFTGHFPHAGVSDKRRPANDLL
jgi:hypothetical protein